MHWQQSQKTINFYLSKISTLFFAYFAHTAQVYLCRQKCVCQQKLMRYKTFMINNTFYYLKKCI